MKFPMLEEEDLLKKSHFPVAVVFDTISTSMCLQVIEGFSEHIGWGGNSGCCLFWEELDELQRKETKVPGDIIFFFWEMPVEEEVALSYAELYYYMQLTCERYAQHYPESREPLQKALQNFREKHDL